MTEISDDITSWVMDREYAAMDIHDFDMDDRINNVPSTNNMHTSVAYCAYDSNYSDQIVHTGYPSLLNEIQNVSSGVLQHSVNSDSHSDISRESSPSTHTQYHTMSSCSMPPSNIIFDGNQNCYMPNFNFQSSSSQDDYCHKFARPETTCNMLDGCSTGNTPYGSLDSQNGDSNDSVEIGQDVFLPDDNCSPCVDFRKRMDYGNRSYNVQSQFPCSDNVVLPDFAELTKKFRNTTRRGRPVTYNKRGHTYHDSEGDDSEGDNYSVISSSPSKLRRGGAKNILLWKFILEELDTSKSSHVQWVNKRDGIFKFVDTAECSKLWGMKKKKDDMNFEKLSRGIRHYYKDGLMSRLDGTRLVYKFHWERVPKAFRTC